MAGWVAVASPVVFKLGGDRGPFDPNQPVTGLLRLGAVFCVLVCLAARRTDPGAAKQTTLINRGALGPIVGGLLLLTIGGFVALDASSQVVLAVLVVTVAALIAARFALPPLPTAARRALVSPYVLISAGLYWTVIETVVGTPGFTAAKHEAQLDPHTAELAVFFLVAFSLVYYAMLIYAPRQIADREGGAVEWVLRYLAFAGSIVLGIGWLGVLGT